MNENLQTALVEIIKRTLSAVDSSIEFLGEQLPDVINQLLLWKFYENLFYCCVGISILITLTVIWFKFSGCGRKIEEGKGDFKNHKITLTHDEDGEISRHIVLFVSVSLMFVLFASFLFNLTWLQILVAPKLFLIEYVASLTK